MRAILGIMMGLLIATPAFGGPSGPTQDGILKWMADADGQFFFIDGNNNLLWDGVPTDAKFRIEGGAQSGLLWVGDNNGNGQDQVGIVTETKAFVESGNYAWTPGSDAGDINFFFAPNVGLTQALAGDFGANGTMNLAKVGTGQFVYVDVNGNNVWNGVPTDAKFRIEGGNQTGVLFAGNFGSGYQIGIFTATKVFLESGNFSWTPGSDAGDVNFFFAPNVGAVDAVVIGDFDGDGADNVGKVAGGFIWLDLNGNMAWDGQPTDAKFRIEGGLLTGPIIAVQADLDAADEVGQFSTQKIFIDNGDGIWAPGGGLEIINFFAPNVGTINEAAAGNFVAP